jgi:hypothetical protein
MLQGRQAQTYAGSMIRLVTTADKTSDVVVATKAN